MNSPQPIWFTSANLQYLDRAAILSESMSQIHSDWTSALVLVDYLPKNSKKFYELTKYFNVIITPEELDISNPQTWIPKYETRQKIKNIGDWLSSLSIVEACTAIKPFAFEFFAKSNLPVFYLDSDIVVFSSLNSVLNGLNEGSSIAVTPHILSPSKNQQSIIDNEIATLKYGIFNFGFLAMDPNKENAKNFIDFWRERLKYFCSENTEIGLFTDQKWGNLLPTFYEDLFISRHPGMNVANWNLENRKLSFDEKGNFQVNGEPLVFYHFSKAKNAGQQMTARYAEENQVVAELWRWYLSELNKKQSIFLSHPWKYSK